MINNWRIFINMADLKHEILEEIKKAHPEYKSGGLYETRINCPFCGDTKLHCYLKCSDDPTEPMLYNCFKCNSKGKVNSWFLHEIGVTGEVCDKLQNQRINRYSQYYMKGKPVDILTGQVVIDSNQVRYVEQRLGEGFTSDDYDKFKIIWDMNNVLQFITNVRTRNTIPSNLNSISFLSDDKTMLMSRTFSPEDHQWRKVRIVNNDNKSFYTIKTTIDLFTTQQIIVNIAEGVFDILSAYKNYGSDNSIYIATLGSDYISGVEYAIAKGFVGNNIDVRIYMDSDQDIRYLSNELKQYKWVFGSIRVYWNALYKDIGVTADKIRLVERRI